MVVVVFRKMVKVSLVQKTLTDELSDLILQKIKEKSKAYYYLFYNKPGISSRPSICNPISGLDLHI